MRIMKMSQISAKPSGFVPDWPAPRGIQAFCAHQSDYRDSEAREDLRQHLGVDPVWLRQTHSNLCVDLQYLIGSNEHPEADAAYLARSISGLQRACVVLTADCLPILLCSRDGLEIAAIHAGWRGLQAGVIEATLARFSAPTAQIMAWLGPAISQPAFEVGPEVRAGFIAAKSEQAKQTAAAFIDSVNPDSVNAERFLADIYQLARLRLAAFGVNQIYGGGFCTVAEPRFHSYRRDGLLAKRMATLIWRES
jgi:polyphenol oxidase